MRIWDSIKNSTPIILVSFIVSILAFHFYESQNTVIVTISTFSAVFVVLELIYQNLPESSDVTIKPDSTSEDRLRSRHSEEDDYKFRMKAINKGDLVGHLQHDAKVRVHLFNRGFLGRSIPFLRKRLGSEDLHTSRIITSYNNGKGVEPNSPKEFDIVLDFDDADSFKEKIQDYDYGRFYFEVEISDEDSYWTSTKKTINLEDDLGL